MNIYEMISESKFGNQFSPVKCRTNQKPQIILLATRGCKGRACPRGPAGAGGLGPEPAGFLSAGLRAQYLSYYNTKNKTSYSGQARK